MDFRITRDGYGVPHVRAEAAVDAWFGMGYACAWDRLFQLDYDRRRACGQWAEIAGVAAVGSDVLARRLGLENAARRDVEAMSPPLRAAFEAYADGINQAIAEGALPLPGRYRVERWQAWHSVAAYLIRHVLMGQWQHKLTNAVLLARIGPEAFARLETRPPLGSPIAVPPDGRLTRPVSRLLESALGDVAGHLGFLAEVEPGSNAWAVSGRRTAHGGAVLCNDSHRALDTPNVYWQCRVTCPEFDVTGATFPGIPGYPHFGFNGSVAWAITHADADSQDLYLERFEGSRYLTPSGWVEAEARQERILVRDGSSVTVPAWTTEHGPVVHGHPAEGIALTLKWTGIYRPNRGFECLPPMLTARSAAELAGSQDGWVEPVNNLVCADVDGRIAYQCRGEVPVRSSAAARLLPAPGWDGSSEWTGTVPFAALPRAIDPDAGFVMTANNAIVDGDEPYLSYTFAQPYRAERLRSLLTGPGVLSVDTLAGMQADTVSWAARAWGRLLAEAGPFATEGDGGGASGYDDGAESARRLLAAFDGNLAADSAAALLYGCFIRALAETLYRPVLGSQTWAWIASGPLPPTMSMIRRWLGNDTWELLGGPVPPVVEGPVVEGPVVEGPVVEGPVVEGPVVESTVAEDPAGERAAARAERRERVLAVLPAALSLAWAAAVQAGGRDPRQWRWGPVHRAMRVHPLALASHDATAGAPSAAVDADALTIGTFPAVRMGGDADTIQAAGYGWRGGSSFTVTSLSVYRQVIDLAAPESASYVIPGGSSGDPGSPHFADQLAEWAAGRRIPMFPRAERG